MSEVKLKIKTLNGRDLVNSNTAIKLISGISTQSRIGNDTVVSIRDFNGVVEVEVTIDAVNRESVKDFIQLQ